MISSRQLTPYSYAAFLARPCKRCTSSRPLNFLGARPFSHFKPSTSAPPAHPSTTPIRTRRNPCVIAPMSRRSQSTKGDVKTMDSSRNRTGPRLHHEGEHDTGHGHDNGHSHGAEVMHALQSSGDRGTRITLIGLFANVALTGAKGVAGWYMHSASLLADAGHSLSDLLGDFVTLVCWNLSRKPPSQRYPYGFAKFETLGTTTVSLLLIGGALGIGYHSYHLLLEALAQAASSMPTSPLHDALDRTIAILQSVPAIGHTHVDAHAPITELDPNAAWFAAVSVVAKEWLYRATKTVADEERSPVLHANAVHHRSDAYSSLVALFAIVGSVLFPAIPLDPIGGLLVSLVILRQGLGLFGGALGDITDASVPATTRYSLIKALDPLLEPSSSLAGASALLGIRDLRARRAGSLFFVDLSVDVSASPSFQRATELEEEITRTLKAARREVAEVRIRFHPVHREEL